MSTVNEQWGEIFLLQRQNTILLEHLRVGDIAKSGGLATGELISKQGFRCLAFFGLATEELSAKRYWVCCTFGFLILLFMFTWISFHSKSSEAFGMNPQLEW
jgi:hypothetical protein